MCLERDGYLYRGSVEQIAGQKYKIYVADAYFYGLQVSKNPEFIWINPTDAGWYICD